MLGQTAIEDRALRFVLTRLGDAVTIKAERANDAWRVNVYGVAMSDRLGILVYSPEGEIVFEQSTATAEMRRKARVRASVRGCGVRATEGDGRDSCNR
ncbi:MAG: hypothetical protein HZC40_02400 [Chloroflexi bacterium]|nr:hypothetical protein [Chloroflexota bacterium]